MLNMLLNRKQAGLGLGILLIIGAWAGRSEAFTPFSGIAADVPLASLSGWTICYEDNYIDSGTPIATILAACNQDYLMLACREVGSPNLTLAAYAPLADVIFDTGSSDTPHDANGVGWYFSDDYSWGFAPQGSPIDRDSCDYLDSNTYLGVGGVSDGDLRLCYHTGGGTMNGGWRCGREDFLQSSSAFERVILQANSACGDTTIDAGEQCDDGNTANGDCCDSACQYESNGSPCPSDGDVCTTDVCDGAGSCGVFNTAPCDDLNACTENDACDGAGTCMGGPPLDCDDENICTQDSCDTEMGCANNHTPISSCKQAGKSILLLKNNTDDSKDKLTFKWLKGAETMLGELATPTGTTNYTLCLYAGTTSVSIALPSGSNWQPLGTKGYKYKDTTTSLQPDGAQKAKLKSGAAGKAKVLVKGKGANLPDGLAPELPLPMTAQVVNDVNGTCFEAVYESGDVIKNDEKQFKAKAQ